MDKVLSALEGVFRSGEGHKAVCPSHADWAASLHVSPGEGGRILLKCHAGCKTEDVLRAAGLTWADLSGDGSEYAGPPRVKATDEDIVLRDRVYRGLLRRLQLADGDRQALLARGLTDEAISRNGYRTLTQVLVARAADTLHEFEGADLFRVPGFVPHAGTARVEQTYGLLIPVRDAGGRIVACQVRTGERNRKYVWLSSEEARSGSPCHVPMGVGNASGRTANNTGAGGDHVVDGGRAANSGHKNASRLIVTEGPLKADVVWDRLKQPVVAVPGVTSWHGCLDAVLALNPDRVQLAFDMDWHTKTGVAEQLGQLEEALRQAGYPTERLEWDPKFKGIDDALVGGCVPAPRAVRGADRAGGSAGADGGTRVSVPKIEAATPDDVDALAEQLGIGFVRARDIRAEPLRWFWYGWLAYGTFCVLEGDPGRGKSTLMCAIAASVTTGRPLFPDTKPRRPGNVVFMSGEDDIARTLVPRLEAAGYDKDRVGFITGCKGTANPDPRKGEVQGESLMTFPNDIPRIRSLLKAYRAELFVIDPLTAFFSPQIDPHKDAHVRRVTAAIQQMTASLDCVTTAVRHLNKDSSQSILYRGGGSIAVTAQARSVLHLAYEPGQDNEDTGPGRVLFNVKNNLAPTQRPIRVELESVRDADGEVISSRLKDPWEQSGLVAADIGGAGRSKDEGIGPIHQWLFLQIARGPAEGVPVADLIAGAAKVDPEWDRHKLDRARKKLGLKCGDPGIVIKRGNWGLLFDAKAFEDTETKEVPDGGDGGKAEPAKRRPSRAKGRK